MSRVYLTVNAADMLLHLAGGQPQWRTAEQIGITSGIGTFETWLLLRHLVSIGLVDTERYHGEPVYKIAERGYDWLAEDTEPDAPTPEDVGQMRLGEDAP